MLKKIKFLTGVALVAIVASVGTIAVAQTASDTLLFGRLIVKATKDTATPACASSTTDGGLCAGGDLEAEDDLFVADDATITDTLTVSDVVMSEGYTADPCGTLGEGAIFYNTTANEVCFCDGTNDLRIKDATTACF